MPLEPNLATVAGVVVAVVLATMVGGLLGRRLRTWHERHAARRALAAMARDARPTGTPVPIPDPVDPAVATAAPSSAMTARASTTGVPDASSIVGQSYLARRLAGAPPPVVTRRPSSLSPALEARGGRPYTPPPAAGIAAPVRPGRRRRRLAVASALVVSLFAVGIVLGLTGTSRLPRGEVLDAAGTPGPPGADDGIALVPDGTPTDEPGGESALEPTPEGEPPTDRVTEGPATTDVVDRTDATSPTDRPTRRPTTRRTAGAPHQTGADPTERPTDPPKPDPTPRPTPRPTPTPPPTDPPAQAPRVSFDFSVDGLRVSFSNHTKGADSWIWDFGDGETSTARRPSHTYASPGRYTVTLTGYATGGATASESQDVSVSD
jgi:hypothetical protein